MSTHFSRMTRYENELSEAFEEDHYGHSISYSFYPTGIGDCVKIKCVKCETTEDITDYESW